MTPTRPIFVVEDLSSYDMTSIEARKLEEMGLIFHNAGETDNPDERETTALMWDELGLDGDRAFLLFDVILGRRRREE